MLGKRTVFEAFASRLRGLSPTLLPMSSPPTRREGMKAKGAVLVVLAAAVTLTAAASAGPQAARQRVAITSQAAKTTHVSAVVLTPLQPGPLKRDSGKLTATFGTQRAVMREGQEV